MSKYLIWQSSTLGWHLSRVDGHTDQHTQAGPLVALQSYCDANGLEYTVYPLEEIVSKTCIDTFRYVKVTA